MALLNSSWNISHKILYWLFKTDRKPRSHVVLPWDRIFFQRYFRFLAVAQNFNCATNNFPHFHDQANAEKLYILFYQNISLYTLKIEIETVQCSFLGFRPSGDRVLPLSMSTLLSLALRRDMLRVRCNSSGISSMSAIEWPGCRLKWDGTLVGAFAWSGLFVACLCCVNEVCVLFHLFIVFYIFYRGSYMLGLLSHN